jgi:hypothetical protein
MAIFMAIISLNSSEANYPGTLLVMVLIILSIFRNIELFSNLHLGVLGGLLVLALLNITYWITANLQGNPSKYSGTQSNFDLIMMLKTLVVQIFTSLPVISGFIQGSNSHEFNHAVSQESNGVSPISMTLLVILPTLLTLLILLALIQFRSLTLEGQKEKLSGWKFAIFAILSVLPMMVIATGTKYQIELLSEFTYYVGAPVFCITLILLSLFRLRETKFMTSFVVAFIIIFVSGFQLIENLKSANTIRAKFSYLKVVQVVVSDPDSLSTPVFCNSKDEVVRRDYAGLGKTTGDELENSYFRKNTSIKTCPK